MIVCSMQCTTLSEICTCTPCMTHNEYLISHTKQNPHRVDDQHVHALTQASILRCMMQNRVPNDTLVCATALKQRKYLKQWQYIISRVACTSKPTCLKHISPGNYVYSVYTNLQISYAYKSLYRRTLVVQPLVSVHNQFTNQTHLQTFEHTHTHCTFTLAYL
jgi:hypothetical protein